MKYGRKIDKFILECKANGVKVEFYKWNEDPDLNMSSIQTDNLNDSDSVIISSKGKCFRINKVDKKILISFNGKIYRHLKTQDEIIDFVVCSFKK